MFFEERIRSITEADKVLEVGPGATPHPRSDVFLEKNYETEKERIDQSGRVGILQTEKQVVYNDTLPFPFESKAFDYSIASHVLEHVEDPTEFCRELERISAKGYVEFPGFHYEYMYNIPEHLNVMAIQQGEILWMPKNSLPCFQDAVAQRFLKESLDKGYTDLVNQLLPHLIHGMEWHGSIRVRRVHSLQELLGMPVELPRYVKPMPPKKKWYQKWLGIV
jgi:SAM-dependent methyltransferase